MLCPLCEGEVRFIETVVDNEVIDECAECSSCHAVFDLVVEDE